MLSLSEENSIQKNREEEKEKRIGGGLGSFVIAKKLQNTGVRDVVEPCKVCKGKNSERDIIIFKRSRRRGQLVWAFSRCLGRRGMVRRWLRMVCVGGGSWHWAKQTTHPANHKGKNNERNKIFQLR